MPLMLRPLTSISSQTFFRIFCPTFCLANCQAFNSNRKSSSLSSPSLTLLCCSSTSSSNSFSSMRSDSGNFRFSSKSSATLARMASNSSETSLIDVSYLKMQKCFVNADWKAPQKLQNITKKKKTLERIIATSLHAKVPIWIGNKLLYLPFLKMPSKFCKYQFEFLESFIFKVNKNFINKTGIFEKRSNLFYHLPKSPSLFSVNFRRRMIAGRFRDKFVKISVGTFALVYSDFFSVLWKFLFRVDC